MEIESYIVASDQQLIERVLKGDAAAFEHLFDRYREAMFQLYMQRTGGNRDDTDDLLQEIFIKIWSALPAFRGDSRLFTWIYRIATNETLNWLHKQKVRSMLRFESLDSTMADKVDDDPYFNGNEAQRLLFKAIARLPQKQKAVFTMRYFDELSYEEISEILGTSVGALKASYHFAAEIIRSEIESGIKP